MSRKRLAKKTAGRPQSRPDGPESAAIAEATRRLEIRKPRLVAICEQSSAGRVQTLGPDHDDHAGWLARLQDAFGTHGTAFAIAQLNKLIASSRTADGKIEHVKLNSMLAMIEGAAPANEIQAALAVQMAVVHAVVLHVLLRASTVDQVPQFDSASNSAVKLLRTFAMQAETLAKLQRGGEQVVKVVHVHPGAQAIVGNVVRGQHGLRGGVDDEKGCQPHAKAELPAASLVSVFEVRSEDAQRQTVPVAVCER